MSSSTTDVPDIEELALRAKEMLERVTSHSVTTSTAGTASTAALRTAVSTTTDSDVRDDLDLYRDPVFGDVADELMEDESEDSVALDDTPNEQSNQAADALLEKDGQVLDTAQHDSAKRRLGILANRAKDSLRAAQSEAQRAEGVGVPSAPSQPSETEDTRRATAALFGSDDAVQELDEDANADGEDDADGDGWVSHYDPEANPEPESESSLNDETKLLFGDEPSVIAADESLHSEKTEAEQQLAHTSAFLDEPLSIERSDIDFPALGTSLDAEATSEIADDESEDSKDDELDPQVAIFAPPDDITPTREPADERLENQFSPIDPAVDERDLAPLTTGDDKRDGRATAIAAAVFLVVVVGGFALLSTLTGNDAGTDLASQDSADDPVVAETDATPEANPAETEEPASESPVDPVAEEAESDEGTEVLGQVEESETEAVVETEPDPTTWAILLETQEASDFVAIGESVGLQSLLDDPDGAGQDYTVFAPSNAAIAALPAERLETLLNDPAAAEAFVSDHLILGRQTVASLSESAGQVLAARSGAPVLIRDVDDRILVNGSVAFTDRGPAGVDAPIFILDGALEAPTINQLLELESIQFEVISATITESGQGELDRVVAYLETLPEAEVLIEGHTDTDGEADANLALSERRAQAVLDYLIANGIDETRLEAVGFGESEPVIVNGVEDKDASRRIELVLQ